MGKVVNGMYLDCNHSSFVCDVTMLNLKISLCFKDFIFIYNFERID